jgi:predicted transcriptional regulator
VKFNKYNTNEEGLNRFLGALEAKIMNVIWDCDDLTIKDVQQRLYESNPLSINTVMTVMNRLVEKGHLQKKAGGRSACYRAVQTKDQFLSEQSRAVAQGLIEDFGGLMVSHMVETMEKVDPALLKQLEEKLNEMKRRNQ